MNLLQWEFDVLPTKVLKEDKAEYIQSLIDTREKEDLNIFLNCMARHHCQHLQADIEQFVNSTTEKGGQKTSEVDRKGGQKTRDVILDMIIQDAKVTSTQMAESLGINRSAVSKDLKKMQENGIIKRVGPDKGGHWEIIEKDKWL